MFMVIVSRKRLLPTLLKQEVHLPQSTSYGLRSFSLPRSKGDRDARFGLLSAERTVDGVEDATEACDDEIDADVPQLVVLMALPCFVAAPADWLVGSDLRAALVASHV